MKQDILLTPTFRGPILTLGLLSLIVLLADAMAESWFGGSIAPKFVPGQLWNHGKVVAVPISVWRELYVLYVAREIAFIGFMAVLITLVFVNFTRPAWYFRTRSWMWVNIALGFVIAVASVVAVTL